MDLVEKIPVVVAILFLVGLLRALQWRRHSKVAWGCRCLAGMVFISVWWGIGLTSLVTGSAFLLLGILALANFGMGANAGQGSSLAPMAGGQLVGFGLVLVSISVFINYVKMRLMYAATMPPLEKPHAQADPGSSDGLDSTKG